MAGLGEAWETAAHLNPASGSSRTVLCAEGKRSMDETDVGKGVTPPAGQHQ